MQELFYVLCVVLAVGIVLTIMAVRTGAILAWLEKALTIGSTALILFTMCFVTLEIVLRHWFNSPILRLQKNGCILYSVAKCPRGHDVNRRQSTRRCEEQS